MSQSSVWLTAKDASRDHTIVSSEDKVPGVWLVTMNQPEQHKMLTPLMMGALAREIDRLSAKGPDESKNQVLKARPFLVPRFPFWLKSGTSWYLPRLVYKETHHKTKLDEVLVCSPIIRADDLPLVIPEWPVTPHIYLRSLRTEVDRTPEQRELVLMDMVDPYVGALRSLISG